MFVIHGIWTAASTTAFNNEGNFYIWVETDRAIHKPGKSIHPYHLEKFPLTDFFQSRVIISNFQTLPKPGRKIPENPSTTLYVTLPTTNSIPLPSPFMERQEDAESFTLQTWQVTAFPVQDVFLFLKELHFASLYFPSDIRLGSDIQFWYQVYRSWVSAIFLKDQYYPGLRVIQNKSKSQFAPRWDMHPAAVTEICTNFSKQMPLCCRMTRLESDSKSSTTCFEPTSLIKHFLENNQHRRFRLMSYTQKIQKAFVDTVFESHFALFGGSFAEQRNSISETVLKKWATWRSAIEHGHHKAGFSFRFVLNNADSSRPDDWKLEFQIQSNSDLSLKLSLTDYWSGKDKLRMKKNFGSDLDKQVLLYLGYASRIYPKITPELNKPNPASVSLNLTEVWQFLQEDAWILTDAGFKIHLPAWWTPKGNQRLKIKLNTKPATRKATSAQKSFFGLSELIKFRYEIKLDDQTLTESEWQEIVNAKQPLVNIRGQWMELDSEKKDSLIEFWQKNKDKDFEATFSDILRESIRDQIDYPVEYDASMQTLLEQLQKKQSFNLIEPPKSFVGQLRTYQSKGVSWLDFLEKSQLNPCLADDMGLGKTVQIIAYLLLGKERNPNLKTLLVVPKTLLGNWQREFQKFAPTLTCLIFHGAKREKDTKQFLALVADVDIVITSFTMIASDHSLFKARTWDKLIIDEAQNIKNPSTAQTKSIISLTANQRIALTGTPVENRLMDLWSIMHFLNPGYLGTQKQFREKFELPVQKDNDRSRAEMLQRLVEPFILRRLKTDKTIISDLPDKIEQKVYCELTREQASIYEAYVKEVERKIDEVEGINRKGLILAALAHLKQICNHPAHYLQDNSAFAIDRSSKLERLLEMLDETMANSESVLIFTQFTEIGSELEQLFRKDRHYPTYYLHGGTSQTKRDQMVTEFQHPDTPPAIFILSLKAGGVGLTLTKANHVFHFDRWWNPSVENQATDRAFRIGQKKNVMVHKFVTMGTIEERIDAMIEEKKALAESIVGTGESWLTNLDNRTFIDLIKLSKETVRQ